MTKKTRRMKAKAKIERLKIRREAQKLTGRHNRANYDQYALNRMKRARAESNWLAERMARDAR
jgi:hypothetical protein